MLLLQTSRLHLTASKFDKYLKPTGDSEPVADQNFRVKNGINVGTAVTITTSEFQVGSTRIHDKGIVAGIITATSFVGDGSGLTNAGSTLSAASGTQRIV